MSEAGTVAVLTDEVRAMRSQLNVVVMRLNDVLAASRERAVSEPAVALDSLPEEAREALQAREAARARGFFRVKEFAAAVGRHPHFVSDLCKSRVIKSVLGRKPYRIPYEEYDVWMRRTEEKFGPRSKMRGLR